MKSTIHTSYLFPGTARFKTSKAVSIHPYFYKSINHFKASLSLLFFLATLSSSTTSFSQAPLKQWDATFGGSDGDFLSGVQQTSDGGFISGGYSDSGISGDKTQSSRGASDYWIVKSNGNGAKQWDVRFGGNSVDHLSSVKQTSDGGYILGGNSFSGISGDKTQTSQGQNDYWIVKTDVNGVKQWDARFGGTSYEELNALQQTSDGGYILGGFSMSENNGDKTQAGRGGDDYWVVKVNANGVKQWDRRFGGNKFDVLNALQQTSDGGYILGGYSLSGITGDKTQDNKGASDYWVVKINANGLKEWDASYGGISDDWLTSLQQTTDGGYILGGWSFSGISGDKTQATKGENDYWIVKIDANGVKQWDADFGGSSNDYLTPLQQTADGGYILSGYSSSPISGDKTQAGPGGTDYWMVKTDVNGIKQWDATFGGSDFEFLYGMDQTTDGGYILGGYSSSPASGDKTEGSKGLNDYWIVKVSAGSTSCDIPVNLAAVSVSSTQAQLNWDDAGGAISYNLRYKVAGTTAWTTVKSNVSAKTLKNLLPGTNYFWQVRSVCQDQPKITSDWSEKASFTTNPQRMENASEVTMMEVYPNPVSISTSVSFSLPVESDVVIDVLDVNGRLVKSIAADHFSEGSHEVKFDTGFLTAGIYFLQVRTSTGILVKKMVKE